MSFAIQPRSADRKGFLGWKKPGMNDGRRLILSAANHCRYAALRQH
ncbi:hypothetical protein [Neobacillus sp. YIM B06451]|nr:hypothetical protein [Neobacillus sp. YIM B06451]